MATVKTPETFNIGNLSFNKLTKQDLKIDRETAVDTLSKFEPSPFMTYGEATQMLNQIAKIWHPYYANILYDFIPSINGINNMFAYLKCQMQKMFYLKNHPDYKYYNFAELTEKFISDIEYTSDHISIDHIIRMQHLFINMIESLNKLRCSIKKINNDAILFDLYIHYITEINADSINKIPMNQLINKESYDLTNLNIFESPRFIKVKNKIFPLIQNAINKGSNYFVTSEIDISMIFIVDFETMTTFDYRDIVSILNRVGIPVFGCNQNDVVTIYWYNTNK